MYSKFELTSIRQISKPFVWPAFWKAECITFPVFFVESAILPVPIIPDARWGTVPPEQSVTNTVAISNVLYNKNKIFKKFKSKNVKVYWKLEIIRSKILLYENDDNIYNCIISKKENIFQPKKIFQLSLWSKQYKESQESESNAQIKSKN